LHGRVTPKNILPLKQSNSNSTTHLLIFLGGHLPQTSGFRLAKQIFVADFRFTPWAGILSDRNIFCTLGGGRIMAGSNAPCTFLVNLILLLNNLGARGFVIIIMIISVIIIIN